MYIKHTLPLFMKPVRVSLYNFILCFTLLIAYGFSRTLWDCFALSILLVCHVYFVYLQNHYVLLSIVQSDAELGLNGVITWAEPLCCWLGLHPHSIELPVT